jgi:hypothetical protein
METVPYTLSLTRTPTDHSKKIVDPVVLTHVNKELKELGKSRIIPGFRKKCLPVIKCQLSGVDCKFVFSLPIMQNLYRTVMGVQTCAKPNLQNLYGSFHCINCALQFILDSGEDAWKKLPNDSANLKPDWPYVKKTLWDMFVANMAAIYLRDVPFDSENDRNAIELFKVGCSLEMGNLQDNEFYGGKIYVNNWVDNHVSQTLHYIDFSSYEQLNVLISHAEVILAQVNEKKSRHQQNRKAKREFFAFECLS